MSHLHLHPPTSLELLSRPTASYFLPDWPHLIFNFSLLLHQASIQINSILFSSQPAMSHLQLYIPTPIKLLSRSTMSYCPPNQQHLIFDFTFLLPCSSYSDQHCLILLLTNNVSSLTFHSYSHPAPILTNNVPSLTLHSYSH